MTPATLHARLLGVTRTAFVAEDQLNDPALPRTGTGVVRASVSAGGAIEWEESGTWNAGEDGANYWNRLRWEFDGAELRLHHLRRGADAPVHLVSLTCDDEGALIPKAPHQCGPDDYFATVSVTPVEIRVSWEVRGPRKGYSLTTTYR